MVQPISSYLSANNDIYAPLDPNPSLQQYDNYQIYSLVCIDRQFASSRTQYFQETGRGLTTIFDRVTRTASLVPNLPPVITNTTSETKQNNWLAIQSFSPNTIPINFLDYVNMYHD